MTDAPTGIPSARVPGSVTFVGVAALVFASFGLLGSAIGLLGLITQRNGIETMRAMGASSPDPASARMMEPMLALQERLLLPTLASQTLGGLAAAMLGAVGILVLLRHRLVPSVAPLLLGAAALLMVGDTGIGIWIQHASMEAMSDMFAGVASLDPAAPPLPPEVQGMFGVMGALGYGCIGGWLMVKLLFVGSSALHLRSPQIAGLFGGPTLLTGRGD